MSTLISIPSTIYNTPFDKLKLKQVRVLFPLSKENLSSYFSPILGQYAIKNTEFIAAFIKQFHERTSNIFLLAFNSEPSEERGLYDNEELVVPLLLNIYKGGKFTILVGALSAGFLFSTCFKKRKRLYRR